MRGLLSGLLVVVIAGVGCGKRAAENPSAVATPGPAVSAEAAAAAADAEAVAVTQRRMGEIGRVLEDYVVAHGAEPEVADANALAASLAGSQGVEVAAVDGWGRPFVITRVDGMLEIRSLGSDGERDDGDPRGIVTDPTADIVMIDGGYTQWHHPR